MASKINQNQKDMLLDYMTKHYIHLFGKFSNKTSNNDKSILWKGIANRLNEVGAEKSVEQWKRVRLLLLCNTRPFLLFFNK